jgi:cytochrome c-type biogenesis protein CcmH/NrfG
MPERHVNALEVVREALRLGDTGSDDWLMLAELSIANGDYDEAVKASRRAVACAKYEGSALLQRWYGWL